MATDVMKLFWQYRRRKDNVPLFFSLFLFFLPLEQILYYLIGLDTVLKPYRIFLIIYLVLLVMRNRFDTINKHFFGFVFIFVYGLIMAGINLAFGSGNLSYVVNGSIHYIFGLLIFLSLPSVLQRCRLSTLFRVFLLGVIVSTLFGVYEFYGSDAFRMRGFLKNPNHLAFYINFASLGLVYQILEKNRFIPRTLLLIFFSLAVVVTGSRTGMILQTVLILYLIYKLHLRSTVYIVLIVTLFTFLNSVNFDDLNVLKRYDIENIKSASGRNDITDAAIRLGKDTFFLGVGIQQYRYYHLEYLSANSYIILADYELGTHNHFLDLLVNFGLLGLVVYIVFLYNSLLFSFRLSKGLRLFYRLSILIILLASLSQEMFMFPLFWLLTGLMANMKNIIRND